MPRRADDVLISVSCSPLELEVLEVLRSKGFTSTANVIRAALWSLADHMQIEMPNRVFDLRTYEKPVTRKPNPRISQHEPYETKRGARAHPWSKGMWRPRKAG